MTSGERKAYFGHHWPDACLANEWLVKDEAQRRAVTAECMRLIRGPQTDSTSALGRDEITALFVYLRYLGDAASLEKSADWVSVKEDYKTFNRARQADWHERELYGTRKNKLDRNRFAGAATAAGSPLDTLDADQVRKRHLTFASRHQRKRRDAKTISPAADAAVVAGTATALQEGINATKDTTHAPGHAPTEAAKPAINHETNTAPVEIAGAVSWADDESTPF